MNTAKLNGCVFSYGEFQSDSIYNNGNNLQVIFFNRPNSPKKGIKLVQFYNILFCMSKINP